MGDITMKMLGSPIIADDNHAEDRARATEGPEKGVDVAPELSQHPVALGESVDDNGQPHRGHHDQVGHGQVDHEHVAWRSQGTCLRSARLDLLKL